jgi:Na+/H+-dicarboxylate symporter
MKVFIQHESAEALGREPETTATVIEFFRHYFLKVSGMIVIPIFGLFVLGASQVLIIGALDLAGVAPQYSFLCLNLALIGVATIFTLRSQPARTWISWRQLMTNVKVGISTMKATVRPIVNAEPICKLLIIRRVTGSSENANMRPAEIVMKRKASHAITIAN